MKNSIKRKKVVFLPGYYVYRIHKGIAKYAAKHGWILDASMAISREVPKNWQGDGIISYISDRDDIVEKIKSAKVPALDLGYLPNKLKLPRVFHDNISIGKMAGEYLIQQGFLNIGYVNYWHRINDSERMVGLKNTVQSYKHNFHELHWQDLEQSLKELPKPLALMIQNNHLANLLLNRLEDLGYNVPEEIAVIGADNDELYCEPASIPITSVDDDLELIGYTAAAKLDAMMDGYEIEPLTLVPPKKVVVRASTNILAIPHQPTAKALKYIRQNFCNPISIDILADECGMCRRRLEDSFKKYIGRTMSQEIQRLRLQKSQKLLLETDLKIVTIATECGFSGDSHFNKLFKNKFNKSPQNYRNCVKIEAHFIKK